MCSRWLRKRRDDAGHAAAVADGRARHLAHEPEAAAAIDEPDMLFGQDAPEIARGLGEGRVDPRARSAKDANVFECGLAFAWHSSRIWPLQASRKRLNRIGIDVNAWIRVRHELGPKSGRSTLCQRRWTGRGASR